MGTARRIPWISFQNQSVQYKNFVYPYSHFKFFKHIFLSFRLMNGFSRVDQHYITVVFMWSLVTMCGALLMIQKQLVGVAVQQNHIYFFVNCFEFCFLQFRYIVTII